MWKILNIEVRKLKSSGMLWVVFGIPFLLALQNLLLSTRFFTQKDPGWTTVLFGQLGLFAIFLFPGIIAVVMAAMMRVEHKGNGWKYLFSLPVKRSQVFIVKFLLGAGLIFIHLMLMSVTNLLVGLLIGIPGPVPYATFLVNPLFAFLYTVPIMALQFLLGLIFTQPLIPIGIGVGLGMPAILMANSVKYWIYYPWTYPIVTLFHDTFEKLVTQQMVLFAVSGTLFAALFTGGLIYFKQRDIIS